MASLPEQNPPLPNDDSDPQETLEWLGALAGAGFAVLTLGAGVTVPGLEADDVIAYAGSVAAVVGLTCVLFLVALQLRQEAARRPR